MFISFPSQNANTWRSCHWKPRADDNREPNNFIQHTGYSNWILLRKLKYFICCLKDLFLTLVWHLSNGISGAKLSWSTLYNRCPSKVCSTGCVNTLPDVRESRNLPDEPLRDPARAFTPVLLSEGGISFGAKYGREDLTRVKRGIRLRCVWKGPTHTWEDFASIEIVPKINHSYEVSTVLRQDLIVAEMLLHFCAFFVCPHDQRWLMTDGQLA